MQTVSSSSLSLLLLNMLLIIGNGNFPIARTEMKQQQRFHFFKQQIINIWPERSEILNQLLRTSVSLFLVESITEQAITKHVPVPAATCWRSLSPLEMCATLNCRIILEDTVPLPEAGAPRITALKAVVAAAHVLIVTMVAPKHTMLLLSN